MIQTDNEKPEVFKDIFDTAEYNKEKYLIFFQPKVTLSCPVFIFPNSSHSPSAVTNTQKSCKESLSTPHGNRQKQMNTICCHTSYIFLNFLPN